MPYKKNILTLLLTVVIILAFGVNSHAGFPCKECHSKRPGAVAMHKAVQVYDCFICHVRGEKLRQKGGIPKEKHETFLRQRTTDARCIKCHDSKTVETAKDVPEEESNRMSGNTYCPKCSITGDKDWKFCPKCGGPILDLEKTMHESAIKPDQAICRKCHFMETDLLKTHNEKIKEGFNPQKDCLECHEGHKDCADCHQ